VAAGGSNGGVKPDTQHSSVRACGDSKDKGESLNGTAKVATDWHASRAAASSSLCGGNSRHGVQGMRFSAKLFHHGRLVLSGIVGEVEEEA